MQKSCHLQHLSMQVWPWEDSSLSELEMAFRRMRAMFEFLEKLGVEFWAFHDRCAPACHCLDYPKVSTCVSVRWLEVCTAEHHAHHRDTRQHCVAWHLSARGLQALQTVRCLSEAQ